MMTTPNPTPEQIIAEAMVNAGAPLMHSRVEEAVAAALHAHGPLSDGDPTKEQGCRGVCEGYEGSPCEHPVGGYACTRETGHEGDHIACSFETHDLTGALSAAAGVAPQGSSECEHEAWEDTGGSRRCSGCKEWLAPQEPSAVRCPACDVDPAAPHNGEGDCPPKPAPSPDRERLIANAEDWLRNGSPLGPRRIIRSLIDALAAQSVLDPEKVSKVIFEETRHRNLTPQARDILTRALCEAAKRGELT